MWRSDLLTLHRHNRVPRHLRHGDWDRRSPGTVYVSLSSSLSLPPLSFNPLSLLFISLYILLIHPTKIHNLNACLSADGYLHILSGEQLAYVPGNYTPEVYGPGAVHHLPRGGPGKQYAMRSACFTLEYARGWIPPMLVGDVSRLGFGTLWRTTAITGREMGGNLLRWKV